MKCPNCKRKMEEIDVYRLGLSLNPKDRDYECKHCNEIIPFWKIKWVVR